MKIYLHDYDETELGERYALLTRLLPDATIEHYSRRAELLEDIAELPAHRAGHRWPLALIDLIHSDRLDGEHLFETITEHPQLRERVALVAFTNYGHPEREQLWKAAGIRAVLNPDELRRPAHGPGALLADLEHVAMGAEEWIRIGKPPAVDENGPLVSHVAELFPELSEEYDEGSVAQWNQARWILLVCNLFASGYTQKEVEKQLGIKRPTIDRLRDQLADNPQAIAIGAVQAGNQTVNLGAVVAAVKRHVGRSPAVWELRQPRRALDGASHLRWIAGTVHRLYPHDPDAVAPAVKRELDPWIPPEYVPWLRHFVREYERLRGGKKNNPAPDVKVAIEIVAARFAIEPQQARHGIVHAVLSLEDTYHESEQLAYGTALSSTLREP